MMSLPGRRPERVRADVLLVESGLAPTRAKAQAMIIAGQVYVANTRLEKPGTLLDRDAPLTLKERPKFVSRGGDKLEGALLAHGLNVRDLVCVDIGASTGGFTDCLLQHGARRVYAVDVGEGLLHERLRNDARVVVRERENARFLTAHSFPEPIDLAVVDASFISLSVLLPALASVLRPGAQLLALVKPQFEVGRRDASRARGVIRDPDVRRAAIARTLDDVVCAGFVLRGRSDSVVRGSKGNVEHFIWAERR